MSILSERLKTLREDLDIKQSDLAEKLGVSKSNVSKYENEGIPNPPYEILIKYAEIFDTTVDYLVGRTDDKNLKLINADNFSVEHDKIVSFSDQELELLQKAMKIILERRGEI